MAKNHISVKKLLDSLQTQLGVKFKNAEIAWKSR